MHVEPNSPAANGGLFLGDILVGMGGKIIEDADDLQAFLTGDKVGQAQSVQIIRGGELREVTVTVGTRS